MSGDCFVPRYDVTFPQHIRKDSERERGSILPLELENRDKMFQSLWSREPRVR